MKKKLKQANLLALLFLLFFSLCGGVQTLYRSGISEDGLKTYRGVLEKADAYKGFGNYGRNYAILLSFEETETVYGIYSGTE